MADLLGRHKSWVCRRLALIEKLGEPAQEELKVGLLSPTCARQLVRLPPGNQPALLDVIRREALTVHELEGVVDLLLARAVTRPAAVHPRRAPGGPEPGRWDMSAVARPAPERDRQPGVATPGAAARAAGADGGLAHARRRRRVDAQGSRDARPALGAARRATPTRSRCSRGTSCPSRCRHDGSGPAGDHPPVPRRGVRSGPSPARCGWTEKPSRP